MDDELLLHAYVDGQLDAVAQARVEQRLQHDEPARLAVAQWLAQREQLQALQREVMNEPVPPKMLATLRSLERRQSRWPLSSPWTQGLAASLLLALGLSAGWIGHRELGAPSTPVLASLPGEVGRAIAHDAIAAHVVYAPDVRRPVEIGADQQELLLRWLSKRLGRSLKLPLLADLGWHLVGGRLLSGDTRGAAPARAQFMYENAGGQRLTLYLSVLAGTASSAAGPNPAIDPNGAAAAFGYASEGATQSFYWTADNFGYALVGELPREVLHRVVNEVYAQTTPSP
ncbi:MAG: anti-sigma factor [Leptothrix sp. (in: b-proteobacteria)]